MLCITDQAHEGSRTILFGKNFLLVHPLRNEDGYEHVHYDDIQGAGWNSHYIPCIPCEIFPPLANPKRVAFIWEPRCYWDEGRTEEGCKRCLVYTLLPNLWPVHLPNLQEIFLISPGLRPLVSKARDVRPKAALSETNRDFASPALPVTLSKSNVTTQSADTMKMT